MKVSLNFLVGCLSLSISLPSQVVLGQSDVVRNGGFESISVSQTDYGRVYSFNDWFTSRDATLSQTPGLHYAGDYSILLPDPHRVVAGSVYGFYLNPTPISLWQDLEVVPERHYRLSYVAAAGIPFLHSPDVADGTGVLNVFLDETTASRIELTNGWNWQPFQVEFKAQTNLLRLRFENDVPGDAVIGLDNVTLTSLDQPPVVRVAQSVREVEKGGTAVLVAAAEGAVSGYQWYFGSEPLAGATNAVLALSDLQVAQSGDYYAEVTNPSGSTRSEPVHLAVFDPALMPRIVAGPDLLNTLTAMRVGRTWDPLTRSDRPSVKIVAGYSGGLRVWAQGEPPLSYEWLRTELPSIPADTNAVAKVIAGQTESILLLTPFRGEKDAGTYQVVVKNPYGTARAEFPFIIVVPSLGEWLHGSFWFGPVEGTGPIVDTDGLTPLGDGYQVQCYVGLDPENLLPIGSPIPLGTGPGAGTFNPVLIDVPDISSGEIAYVQAKAWESAKGRCYEEARDNHGKFGCSSIMTVTVGGLLDQTHPKLNTWSGFSLQAPLPQTTAAKFGTGRLRPDGTAEWALGSEAGLFLLERKTASYPWVPILVLTNHSGATVFRDPLKPSGPTLYRARRFE
jgi:hypothetical protein